MLVLFYSFPDRLSFAGDFAQGWGRGEATVSHWSVPLDSEAGSVKEGVFCHSSAPSAFFILYTQQQGWILVLPNTTWKT